MKHTLKKYVVYSSLLLSMATVLLPSIAITQEKTGEITNEIKSSLIKAQVNINTADAQTLAKHLKGIGSKKAELIIEYRDQYGPFKSIEEITNVKGIGAVTFNINKQLLRVD